MFDGSGFVSVGTVNAEVFDFTFLLLIKSVEAIIKAMAVLTSLHLQCLTCCSIQADGQKALAAAKELFVYQYTPHSNGKLCVLPTVITTTQGTTYLNVKFRALPDKTEYPGVTEKGLQVTRVYEIKDAEGNWKPATEFRVGDVVRVTLTCAKLAPPAEAQLMYDPQTYGLSPNTSIISH